jgi:hypothetical protein
MPGSRIILKAKMFINMMWNTGNKKAGWTKT